MTEQQYTALQTKLTDAQYLTCEMKDELAVINVRHPLFQAELTTQGAQLLRFRAQNRDWLWLSDKAEYKRGTSLRGGIPVCWPWFGDAAKNPTAIQTMISSDQPPAHGFARSQEWELRSFSESDEAVEIRLALAPGQHPSWKGDASVELNMSLSSAALSLQLTTTAGKSPVCYSQALHTYFPTSEIDSTHIEGLSGNHYIDALDQWSEKTQEGAVTFNEETDRIYAVDRPLVLTTPEYTMRLTGNNHTAVVWNPWVEKSKRLSQFDDDAWQRMFCVESANVMQDAVQLQPGESHTLEMRLELE
ncbi:MAG: D-hexose-6-phosphate mutarotase [Pseudomonadota bacterium]|nr:D-hexose-6-phosphate mutarotase [Pseudomonadota bacterium]MEC8103619.1 D-hexose-6-phosphate mutarotase [Pseudomonadota bacterium]MEC8525625.1 D-hexose-6-phosphate mutarotase [Pseudomonadota bacterium]